MSITTFLRNSWNASGWPIGMGRYSEQEHCDRAKNSSITQLPPIKENGVAQDRGGASLRKDRIMNRGSIGRAQRWMVAAGAVAGVLLGVGILAPKTAEAQTTFLSNTEQAGTSRQIVGGTGSQTNNLGLSQAFRTGTATNGYFLTRIVIRSGGAGPWIRHLTAEVRTDNGGDPSDTVHAALSEPSSVGNNPENVNFDVDGDPVALDNDTIYHIVLRFTGPDPAAALISFRWQIYTGDLTAQNTHPTDSGATAGWSIPSHGKRLSSGSWETLPGTPLSRVLKFQVVGTDEADEAEENAAGDLTINGTPKVGVQLQADPSGIDDPDGLTAPVTYSYQWERADDVTDPANLVGRADVGTDSATYTPVKDDQDKFLRVTATFMDDDRNEETKTSTWTSAVARRDDSAPTGEVTIAGSDMAQVGVELEAITSAIDDPVNGLTAPNYRYQWKRADDVTDPANLVGLIDVGTDSAAYTPITADQGTFLRVEVTFTDDDRYEGTMTSAWTVAVAAAAPTPTPTVSSFISNVERPVQFLEERITGQAFTTGSETAGYTLSGVDLHVGVVGTVTASDGWEVTIRENSSDEPAGNPLYTFVAPASMTANAINTFTAPSNATLDANTRYHIAVDPPNAGSPSYGRTLISGGLDGTAAAGWNFPEGHRAYRDSDGWSSASSGRRTMVRIRGTVGAMAVSRVTISGTIKVDATLTANTDRIIDADGVNTATYSYRWERADDVTDPANPVDPAIVGGDSATYTPAKADQGRFLRVTVSYRDNNGNAKTIASDWTTAVERRNNSLNTGELEIEGIFRVGRLVTVTLGTFDDANGIDENNFMYRWIRESLDSDISIPGATSNTYRLTQADLNHLIYVSADYTDNDGYIGIATSRAIPTTVAAQAANTEAGGEVTIDDGTMAQVGVQLSAVTMGTTPITDANGLTASEYSYRWEQASDVTTDPANPAGLTDVGTDSENYTPDAADEGRYLRVVVTFIDDDGHEETKTSEWTIAVLAVGATLDTEAIGDVTVDGIVRVGAQLRADTSDIDDPVNGLTAPVTYRYQWQRADDVTDPANPVDLTDVGTDSENYTPNALDETKYLRVVVRFMDDDRHEETKMSDWVGPVGAAAATPNTEATGEVTVANDPPPADGMTVVKVGVMLTADTDGIDDPVNGLTAPVTYRYQWQRADDVTDPANPVGRTDVGTDSATYTPAKVDQDKFLRVVVMFNDNDGYPETKESEWTSAVAKRDDAAATGDVTVDGGAAAQVDVQLSANTSTIDDPVNGLTAPNYRYQWQRADNVTDPANPAGLTDVGADSATYTPVKDDQDKFLRVAVTFTDDDDYEEVLESEWTREVAKRANAAATGAPTITGTVKEGESLTADPSAIDDANGTTGVTFEYQWQRQDAAGAWSDIAGSTAIYTLAAADIGMRIRVRVSFDDNDDYPESVASDATAPITSATNTLATGAPGIVGVPRVGRILRATPGTVDDNDGLTSPVYDYQWQRGDPGAVIAWTDIPDAGATSSSYTLTAADEGKKIRVKVAFRDDDGSLEERPSAAYPAASDVVEPADAPATDGTSSVFTIESLAPAIDEPSAGTVDLVFVVALARSADQAAATLTVDFRFTGSAREGRDFTHSGAQRLSFAEGVVEQIITVTVNGDIVAEPGGETIEVTLDSPSPGASLGEDRSATVTINEQDSQIYVETTNPQYTKEDRTVSFAISLSTGAPVAGLVEWRLVFDGDGAAAASARSAESRATVNCVVGRPCTGRAVFRAGSPDPTEDTSAVFDSDLPVGTVMRLQVKPFAADSGSSLPSGTISAVKPTVRLSSSEAEIVAGGWVNAGKETLGLPLPKGLVHSFAGVGRTVAINIVDGIWRRADARRTGRLESQATLGGKTLDTQALSSGDAGQTVREIASLLGLEPTAPDASLDGLNGGHSGNFEDYRAWAGIPDQHLVASQTSFALSAGELLNTGSVTVWGEMLVTGGESRPDKTSFVDSESSDILLGFDLPAGDDILYGLAISRFSGESEYRDVSGADASGTAETSLTTFAPYVHWTGASGISLWGSLGRGSGTLEATIDGRGAETDVGMTMLGGGARTAFTRIGRGEFAMRGDIFRTVMDAERAAGFSNISAKASRIRLAVEGATTWEMDNGAVTSNRMELGARMDSGDGEEGVGVDVAAEIRYATQDGLEIKGRLSSLLLHQQDGFREWGAGLGFTYAPGIAGRGVSLSFEPTWNVPRTGVAESMWGSQHLDGYAFSDNGAAMKARLGFGTGTMRDRMLATLYGETKSGDDSQRLRLGAELRGLAGPLERLSLDVYGQREEGQLPRPNDSVMLEGSLGF